MSDVQCPIANQEWRFAYSALKARNVIAWGTAPGGTSCGFSALKARNVLDAAHLRLARLISRLQRFYRLEELFPGPMAQAITFRALGAEKMNSIKARGSYSVTPSPPASGLIQDEIALLRSFSRDDAVP
jgi:hypothetical protein